MERQRQIKRHRHTGTHAHTHTNKHRQTQTHTHTHKHRHTHTHTHTHTQTQTRETKQAHTDRQTDRQTHRSTHAPEAKQAHHHMKLLVTHRFNSTCCVAIDLAFASCLFQCATVEKWTRHQHNFYTFLVWWTESTLVVSSCSARLEPCFPCLSLTLSFILAPPHNTPSLHFTLLHACC